MIRKNPFEELKRSEREQLRIAHQRFDARILALGDEVNHPAPGPVDPMENLRKLSDLYRDAFNQFAVNLSTAITYAGIQVFGTAAQVDEANRIMRGER